MWQPAVSHELAKELFLAGVSLTHITLFWLFRQVSFSSSPAERSTALSLLAGECCAHRARLDGKFISLGVDRFDAPVI